MIKLEPAPIFTIIDEDTLNETRRMIWSNYDKEIEKYNNGLKSWNKWISFSCFKKCFLIILSWFIK